MSAYSDAVLADSPAVYWRLGEATTLLDSSGNGKTASSHAVTLGQPGLLTDDPDLAVATVGDGGHVWLPEAEAPYLHSAAGLTLEGWVAAPAGAPAGVHDIFGRWRGTSASQIVQVRQEADDALVVWSKDYNGLSTNLVSGPMPGLRDGQRHHVVLTYAPGSLVLYVDGQVIVSSTTVLGPRYSGAAGLFFGSMYGSNTMRWQGTLDEFAYYKHALTPARVLAHYRIGTGTAMSSPPGTNVLVNPSFERNLADWTVNGGDGVRLVDDTVAGSAFMQVVSASTANVLAFTGYYPATPGQPWSAGGHARPVNHAGAVRLDIRFVDASFVEIAGGGGLGSNVTIGSAVDYVQVTNENKVAPAGTVWVRLRFVVLAPAAAGVKVDLDAFQLEQAASLPPYNDTSGLVAGNNVLPNPSYEVSTLGWEVTQGDILRVTDEAQDGFACAEVFSRGTSNVAVFSQLLPAVAGDPWSAGVFVHNLSHNANARLDIRFADTAGVEIDGAGSNGPEVNITSFSRFTQLAVENKIAPPGATQVRVRLVMLAPAAAGAKIRIDSWQLEQSASLPPFNPVTTRPAPLPVGAGVNMLANSSFELPFGGLHEHAGANWEGNPVECRSVRPAPDAVHGDLIGVMTNPDGRLTPNWQSEDATYSSCAPGDVLTGSIYFRRAAGSSTWRGRLDIQFFDALDEPIRGSAAVGALYTPTGSWERMITTGVAPAGCTHAQVRVLMYSSAAGDVMEIDAAQLEFGGTATAYKPNVIESPPVVPPRKLNPSRSARRHGEAPQVWIEGTPVAALMSWGDLEWSTVWPGGSDALTFSVARSHRLFRPDARVELRWGGLTLFGGVLDEPVRGEPLVASGLYRLGEQEPALDQFGNATSIPDTAVATAITRGLPWAKAGVLDALYAPIEFTEPLTLSKLLDHFTLTAPGAKGWGISPGGMLDFRPWPAATLHVLPGVDGLGITRDGYASRLTARYATGTGYATVTRVDTAAELRWGRVPDVVPAVLAGGAVLTQAQAEATLDGMLEQGRSQIGWTSQIEVAPGDVVNNHGRPVALEAITAGSTVRVQDLHEDVADLAGLTWVDMHLARVEHKPGSAVLTPRRLVSPMHDVLTGAKEAS